MVASTTKLLPPGGLHECFACDRSTPSPHSFLCTWEVYHAAVAVRDPVFFALVLARPGRGPAQADRPRGGGQESQRGGDATDGGEVGDLAGRALLPQLGGRLQGRQE